MMNTGLLILSSSIASHVRNVLAKASRMVKKTLYVHPYVGRQPIYPVTPETRASALQMVHVLYTSSYACADSLDVRLFLDHLKQRRSEKRTTQFDIEVVLTDVGLPTKELRDFLGSKFVQNFDDVDVVDLEASHDTQRNGVERSENVELKEYENVVLGGTFDRLHAGHKIFLSEAIVRCSRRLTVGVTDEAMIAKKILPELIEPTSFRIEKVTDFLRDVDPFVAYNVVPISDPFGPSIDDPTLESVVVSQETVAGGRKINEKRLVKGFKLLDLCVVELIEDSRRVENEEFKISSSSLRMRSLGTHLRPLQAKPHLPAKPYLIGMTGGIGSGKSHICKHLQKLGAGIVYSDQLAHEAYQQGTAAYKQIVDYFGREVVGSNGEIDRKELGKLVFDNKEKLDKLNSIVWPEVNALMLAAIQELASRGKQVVVLEVPLLIEAGMTNLVHEVWVVTVPPEEAVRRVTTRDKISAEQAEQRIGAQLSNKERVLHADVVFCSLWEASATYNQVDRAWSELQSFLDAQTKARM